MSINKTKTSKAKASTAPKQKPMHNTEVALKSKVRLAAEVVTIYAGTIMACVMAAKELKSFMAMPLDERIDEMSTGLQMLKNFIKA
jgi:Cu/Ag efflux pump CusA